MSDTNDKIQLTLEVKDDGSVVIDNFKGKVVDAFKVSGEETEKYSRKSQTSFQQINQSVEQHRSSILDAAASIYTLGKAWDEVKLGAQFERQADAFHNLADTYHINADSMIANLTRVSKSTVDEAELMKLAGQAMMRGLDPTQLTKLMEIAEATTHITSQTTAEAFGHIEEAVSSTMTRSLKFLGIIINQNDAFKDYAATIHKSVNDLTEFDRQQAIANVTIEQGQQLIYRMGNSVNDTTLKISQQQTVWEEWKNMAAVLATHVFQIIEAGFGVIGFAVNAFAAGVTGVIWAILQAAEEMPILGKYFKIAADAVYELYTHFDTAADEGLKFAKTNWELGTSLDSVGAKARTAKEAVAQMAATWNSQNLKAGISQPVNPFATMYSEADLAKLRQTASNFCQLYTNDAAAALPKVKENTAELNKLQTALEKWNEIIAGEGKSDYEKELIKINDEYDKQIKELGNLLTAQDKATAAKARDIQIGEAQQKQMEKIDDLMKEATKSIETEG